MKVYRIYAPINQAGLCGTMEFGIYRRLHAAKDHLERLAAELALDHNYTVTWDPSGEMFYASRKGTMGVRVRIQTYDVDMMISEDLTERSHCCPVRGSKAIVGRN